MQGPNGMLCSISVGLGRLFGNAVCLSLMRTCEVEFCFKGILAGPEISYNDTIH